MRSSALHRLLLLLCILAALRIGCVLAWHVWIFLQPRAFVNDAELYWAMGRGLLNGLSPYADLFEIKPPGIFVLSALSLGLLGNGYLGNLFGALTLLSIAGSILWFAIRQTRQEAQDDRRLICITAALLGAFWAVFVAEKGQPWQTEVFGSFFALLYVWTLFGEWRSEKMRIAIATLGLMGAIGFKEPFLFSCLGAAILVARHPRALVRSFVIPTAIALALGAVLCLLLGYLGPYLGYYLPTLGYRGYAFGPLWSRSFAFVRITKNLWQVSPAAPFAMVALFAAVGSVAARKQFLIALVCGMYFAMLAVGAAGDYQAHHFAFLTPFVVAGILLLVRISPELHPRVLAAVTTASALTALTTASPGFTLQPEPTMKQTQAVAGGIDTVLDRCSIDRYLLIKRVNALTPMAFTRHSPLNHSLFLQFDNGGQYGQEFLDISLQRLSEAQVIVFPLEGFRASGVVGNAMGEYIARTFSETPLSCAGVLPSMSGYGMMFRSSDEPFTQRFNWVEPAERRWIR